MTVSKTGRRYTSTASARLQCMACRQLQARGSVRITNKQHLLRKIASEQELVETADGRHLSPHFPLDRTTVPQMMAAQRCTSIELLQCTRLTKFSRRYRPCHKKLSFGISLMWHRSPLGNVFRIRNNTVVSSRSVARLPVYCDCCVVPLP